MARVEQNYDYANRVYGLSADQGSLDAQLKLATDLRLQNQSDSLRYYVKALMNDGSKDRIEEVVGSFALIPMRDKIRPNPLSCDEIISTMLAVKIFHINSNLILFLRLLKVVRAV